MVSDRDRYLDNLVDQEQRIKEMQEWLIQTFGGAEHVQGSINHLRKEVEELAEHPDDPGEIADILIIGFHIAACYGIDGLQAMFDKHEINKARKWGERQESGIIEHIKEEAQ